MKKEVPLRVTVIMLAAAAAVCVIGVLLGEPQTVFAKAASICLECIGIG